MSHNIFLVVLKYLQTKNLYQIIFNSINTLLKKKKKIKNPVFKKVLINLYFNELHKVYIYNYIKFV